MTVNLFKLYGFDKKHIGYRIIVQFHLFGRVFYVRTFESNNYLYTVHSLEPVFDMKELK